MPQPLAEPALKQQRIADIPPMALAAPVVPIPPHIESLVMRLLRLSPQDRYPDARAFMAALAALVAKEAQTPSRR